MQELLPEADFRLFAVSVRFPQALARQAALTPVRPGVYEARHFTGVIRLVVVHELPQEEHNALLHLFSARTDLLRYGATHYHVRSEETSTLLLQLFDRYSLEATLMKDALQQMAEETIERLLKELPVEKRLKGLSMGEVLAALPPETLAAGETVEGLLKKLPLEKRLKGASADELLAALPPETRAALAQRLKDYGSPPKPSNGGQGPADAEQ